jgi:hypothetical protein
MTTIVLLKTSPVVELTGKTPDGTKFPNSEIGVRRKKPRT